MKQLLPIVLTVFFGTAAQAADKPDAADPFAYIDAEVSDLSEFVWEKRPIIIFADSPNDPNFNLQLAYLHDRVADMVERDIVVLTDTDPAGDSPLRAKLRPRGFMLVLVGKDGSVALRKPLPWDMRMLSRTIDKMPVRQREIRERRLNNDNG